MSHQKTAAARLVPTGGLKLHPLAGLFPEMSAEEYAALKQSIREGGVREPLLLCDGKVMDGRHRLRACKELKVAAVPVRDWDGKGSAVECVLAANLHRRHLTSGQRAALAAHILPALEEEARERQRRHGGTAPGRPGRAPGPGAGPGESTSGAAPGGETLPPSVGEVSPPGPKAGESARRAARLTGTNPEYVRQAARLQRQCPTYFERVRQGSMTVPQAKRAAQEMKAARGAKDRCLQAGHPYAEACVAYHEAGHAVMYYLLGGTLHGVTIVPGRRGRPRYEGMCQGDLPGEVSEHVILVDLAGGEAEKRFSGMAPARWDGGDAADRAHARDWSEDGYDPPPLVGDGSEGRGGAVRWGRATRRAYLDWLRLRAADVLATACVWSAVEELAEVLLARRRLGGAEAEAVLSRRVGRLQDDSPDSPGEAGAKPRRPNKGRK
jgi:hypothetical protein